MLPDICTLAGVELTVTTVVPTGPAQPLTVALTLYVPLYDVKALGLTGFWIDAV